MRKKERDGGLDRRERDRITLLIVPDGVRGGEGWESEKHSRSASSDFRFDELRARSLSAGLVRSCPVLRKSAD